MRLSRLAFIAGLLAVAGFHASPGALALNVSYLFSLSDFNGMVPYDDVSLHVDRNRDELYAAIGHEVRIFNPSGMESYRFEIDGSYGHIYDMAVDDRGDILLLNLDLSDRGRLPEWYITRCNYRGEPIGRIHATGLPSRYGDFVPSAMIYRDHRFILASRTALMVVVLDRNGVFQSSYDLARMLDIEDARRSDNDMDGFNLDSEGNLIFTIPVLFKAFVVSPGGEIRAFGRPGSIPGSFGIVADIMADDHGHLLVADKLRRVVMVFDENLQFVTEFGAGETGRVWLNRPTRLALGNDGKVYVTQKGNQGVAVYRVSAGGEVIRSDAGPQPRGGADRGGAMQNEPDQSAAESVSVAGTSTKPPVAPSFDGRVRTTGSADHSLTGTPETQGGPLQ